VSLFASWDETSRRELCTSPGRQRPPTRKVSGHKSIVRLCRDFSCRCFPRGVPDRSNRPGALPGESGSDLVRRLFLRPVLATARKRRVAGGPSADLGHALPAMTLVPALSIPHMYWATLNALVAGVDPTSQVRSKLRGGAVSVSTSRGGGPLIAGVPALLGVPFTTTGWESREILAIECGHLFRCRVLLYQVGDRRYVSPRRVEISRGSITKDPPEATSQRVWRPERNPEVRGERAWR